jgi:uncharacterized protein (DUF1697 family)
MDELKAIGEACGFTSVRTYIASGNLLFASGEEEAKAERMIAERLESHFGRPVPVFVRTAEEMADVAAKNPFGDDRPSRVMAHFIREEPRGAMFDEVRDVSGERMALGPRCIYVSYGEGIGKTKLKLPAVKHGTSRNLNTVAKLAALAAELS